MMTRLLPLMLVGMLTAVVLCSPIRAAGLSSQPAAQASKPAFEGRYRRGPEVTSIRIVAFTDYQCPDCDTLDQRLEPILMQRPEIAYSVKHFPFSSVCNPHMPTNPHPNSCWAARAAETAGILRGVDGFRVMHQWLFSRRGSFTDAELHAGLDQMRYDRTEFIRIMTGPETLARVQADIEEGMSIGVFSTPMLFVNGQEVAWRNAGAIEAAIERAAESPPDTAAADRPPTAEEKIVSDWRRSRLIPDMGIAQNRWLGGGEDSKVSIVIWGDLLEPHTARAHQEVLRLIHARRGQEAPLSIRYGFRHYPVDQECNRFAPRTMHPGACAAAQAVEAVFQSVGPVAGWQLHDWIIRNQQALSGQAASAPLTASSILSRAADPLKSVLAENQRFTAELWESAQLQSAVTQRITDDTTMARNLGVTSIPMIFVNGRQIQRWMHANRPVIELIVRAVEEE